MKTENELMPIENSTQELIRFSIEKGADLDKLEKLLTIKERYDAMEAKKAYHVAITAFKSDPPKIEKDKKVSYGQTKYNHASLSNVTEKINEGLSKHGLSASWTTKQNGVISITCKITHVKGHSEETTLSASADKSGSKNDIQAIGSTISYLERYTLLALTGLATSEMDDDGQTSVNEFINEKELNQLVDMINDKEVNLARFLLYMEIDSLENMPKSSFQKAMAALQAKKKGGK